MANNDWKDKLGGIVYSTDPDFVYNDSNDDEIDTLPPSSQKLIVSIDRRNRGGKQVTLVSGFVGKNDDLVTLSKDIKKKCGVGGSAKDGEIIIQGDFRDKIVNYLTPLGYKIKRGN